MVKLPPIKLDLDDYEPPPTDAVVAARLAAREKGRVVFVVNFRNVRGAVVEADSFNPRLYENIRICAVGYPPNWRFTRGGQQ